MPKQKKSKSKKALSAARNNALSGNSLAYYLNIKRVFESLYQNYCAEKLEAPNVLMVTGIEQLNSLHLDDPNSNGVPAVCCVILQNTLSASHFKFLTALKNWGLNINFDNAVKVLLITNALKSRRPEYLSWLLNECEIKILSSGNPMLDSDFKFDLEGTKILDFIEANIGTPEVDFYLDIIPKHHAEGNTVLHLAAIHNRAGLFHKLAASGANINQPNLSGVTPAMLGVAYEDSTIIPLLLGQDYGASIDVSLQTTAQDSLFHYIILGKSIPMLHFAVARLEQHGISFDELTMRNGFNIVHWTIDNAQCSLVYELLQLIDINAPTPDDNHLVVYAFISDEPDIGSHIASHCEIDLHEATFTDDKNIFQIVIEHDALTSFIWLIDEEYFDENSLDNAGRPPLLLASKSESALVVDELFESYALTDLHYDFVDEHGKLFAHYLAKHNLFVNIEILLECNMLDLGHRDNDGNTVLDIALLNGESHARIRNCCLTYIEEDAKRKKPKLNLRLSEIQQLHLLLPVYYEDEIDERASKIDGEDPIHLAYQKYGVDYLLELREKCTININKPNSQGETILCKLVKQKNLAAIKEFIIRCRPALNNLDNNKSSLLQLACEHNFEELIDWCLETQSLSITKARGDKFSALDITLIKRNTVVLHKLWAKLIPQQRSTYLNLLKIRSGQSLLELLEEEGLYIPEENQAETKVESSIDQPSEQKVEQKAVEEESKVESYVSLKQEPEVAIPLTCNEETLFNAVQNQDHEYFRKLKHFTEHNNLLHTHASALLEAATRTKSYRLVYNILRIPVLAENAHFDNNRILIIAATQGTKNIVEALLRINSVALCLLNLNHPAKLAALSNGHTEVAELLDEYIYANQEVQQVESQDATDDDLTITMTNSESPRPGSSALSMFNAPRAPSTFSSTLTDRESVSLSPIEEGIQQFVTTPVPLNDKRINVPIPKTVNSIDILKEGISELNISAKPFEKLPSCFHDKELYKTLQIVTKVFNKADIYGYIYGSAHYKLKPGDLDIVVPHCDINLNRRTINNLVELFKNHGGVISCRDKHTGYYGYSYEGRHVIPLKLRGTTIEIIVYPKSINEHAYSLDFTRSARYLSVRSWDYVAIPGIYANVDIAHKLIQTITNAHLSFEKDPRRIFRAVKQMVDEGDTLSFECLHAIQDLFYGPQNPFITHITIGKMCHRIEVFLKEERPERYFEMLNNLGLFEKIYECFALQSDFSAAYYRNILEPYRRLFNFRKEQEQMQLASQNQYTMYNCGYAVAEQPVVYVQPNVSMGYS